MAIANDANADGGLVFSNTTLSWSHTCSGSDRYLLVSAVGVSSGGATAITGITYNGVSMTQIGLSQQDVGGGTFQEQYVFGLLAPASGAHTVVVTFSSSIFALLGASASYTGVTDGGGTAGTDNKGTGQSTSGTANFSLSLTPNAGSCWSVFLNKVGGTSSTAGVGSTTVITTANGVAIYDSGGTLSGATTMHAVAASGTPQWDGVIVTLAPVSSSQTFTTAVSSAWTVPAPSMTVSGVSFTTAVSSTWTVPTPAVTQPGSLSAPSAESDWTVPTPTVTKGPDPQLFDTAVVSTWTVPTPTVSGSSAASFTTVVTSTWMVGVPAMTGGVQGHGNIATLYELLGEEMPTFNKQFAITASDTVNFKFLQGQEGTTTYPCQAIYVGGAGDIVGVLEDTSTVTLAGATAGSYVIGRFVRVNSTNTTATSLVACYSV